MSTIPRPDRRFRVQRWPNLIREERRLCLTRICWNVGTPGDGKGYSCKLSFSLAWDWKDIVLGARVFPELWGFILRVYFLPCLALRIHFKRAYGGRLC